MNPVILLAPLGALVLIAGALILWRRSLWRASLGVAVAAGAMLAALNLAGLMPPLMLEPIAVRLFNIGLVCLMTAVVLRYVYPRLLTRPKRPAVAIIAAVLAIAHLSVAVALWRVADDFVQLPNVPRVTSEAEILALRDGQYITRLFGVLTEARVGAPDASAGDEVARIACGRPFSSAPQTVLPTILTLTLAGDGAAIDARGITTRREALDWPDGARVNACAISTGDPVVVWSDVGATRSGDTVSGTLIETRLLAYGTLDAFLSGAARKMAEAGMLFTILAGLAALLAIIPIAAGIARWRRIGILDSQEPRP
ncbi:hypothetical protein [Acuticoccus kandeliae]|uniref:hypothetical protein n=1 Tax=Acuticoccus kandeliae TaxID=2073160 RepID=UPI000D3E929A|nr:hypothetical protein [Acuticoccus kandeliae]